MMNRAINLPRILTITCYILLFLSSANVASNAVNQELIKEIGTLDLSLRTGDGDPKLSITDFSMVNSSVDLYSTEVDDDYRIQIGVPSNYNESTSFRYPTVYLIDGNYLFDDTNPHPNAVVGPGGTIGIIEELIETGYLPPCILIGIDYEGNLNSQRFRDFGMPTSRQFFYDFLGEELIPYIEGQYRTDPSSRTIIGHSLGGTLVTYCFFQHNSSHTGVFNQFVMLSGAYSYYLDPIESESSVFESFDGVANPSLNISIFSAIGEQDTSVSVPENMNLTNRLKSRYYKDFRFLGKLYEEHDHASIVRPGIIEGLKWVFSNTSVDFDLDTRIIKEGQLVQFTFTGVEGKKPFTYEWDFGDNSTTSSEMNPNHEFALAGNYTVKITITDGDGFQVSKQLTITVKEPDSTETDSGQSTTTEEQNFTEGFTVFGIVSLSVIVLLGKKRKGGLGL
ncbi:MAG: alpha/beta hydrolase-fold protein [Candidatus Hodarchaeales archaeon]|jgi:predicted alpha/beta superfamily hydrolase